MATHRFIISAGHRNEDRGGARREIEWTYPMSKKLEAAITRRGGQAWIIQEHDGDRDPSFSHGRGLQNVARLCVDLARAVGGVDAYLSMHYEGAAHRIRGFFGIYPDSVYGGVDVAANNPRDIQLIRNIAAAVATTGMPIRSGGLMSERNTHVGAALNARLGEFVGTLGFRDTTARVILEAGQAEHPSDYAMLWSPSWQDRYAEAIVDGLEATFGAFRATPPAPAPTPDPTTPYVAGVRARATDRLNVRAGYGTHHPVVRTLDVGEQVGVVADDRGRTTAFGDGYTWVNVASGWGSGWAASNWLEPVGTPPAPPEPVLDTFTTRFELPFRTDPGFSGRIVATLPVGATGTVLSGPDQHDGIGWYRARLGNGDEGWVPASILRTLDIVGSETAGDVD